MDKPKYKQLFSTACQRIADMAETCPNDLYDWPCSEDCPAMQDLGKCWETYFQHEDGDPARAKEATNEQKR